MKVKLIQETAGLYPLPDENSAPVHTLNRGDVGELGGIKKAAGKKWVEMTLLDGTRGYVPGGTHLFALIQVQLNQKTPLYATADKSLVKMELPRRSLVNFLDLVDHDGHKWIYIQDASGNQGYIEPSGSMTRKDPITKKMGKTNMWVGGVFFAAGAIFTLVSYLTATANTNYYLWWGAIIFGLLQFLQGLYQYLKAKE